MTLQSLDRAIAKARGEFQRLNARHWSLSPGLGGALCRNYVALKPATERRIVALAERVARLARFRGMLAVNAQAGKWR